MSRVAVRIPMALRPFVDGAELLEAEADTVRAVLEQLGARHAGLLQRIVLDDGELRPYVNVFVGSDNVRSSGGLDTTVRDGDVVSIIPAVAGG
ncbi:MAG TPA: ubiquitin-like small modifier protein 1 [Woeseiaceae bacterium]